MKRFTKKAISLLAAVIMVCMMMPVPVFAALNTGHSVAVRFRILYVGSEYNIGYDYGASESTTFVCQYSAPHSDTAATNHTIAEADIKAASERLKGQLSPGYSFTGWTKTVSKDPTVNPFKTYGSTACNKGEIINLVAKRPSVTYTLSYNPNGGSGAPGSQSVTNTSGSATFAIPATVPVRSGYEFKGWSTSATGAAQYQPGSTVTITGNTTLYAVWEKITEVTYVLIYDANGGTGAPSTKTQTGTSGSMSFVVSQDMPIREGYTFSGWAETSDASVPVYSAGDTLVLQASNPVKTIYAVWEPVQAPEITYRLIYNANGGSGAPEAETMTNRDGSAVFTVSSAVPTRDGYDFAGWSTTPDGAAAYQAGDMITITDDTTLYAVWEKIETARIAFRGASIRVPASYDETKAITENAAALEKTHLRFGYVITLPEGMTMENLTWSWEWGTDKNNLNKKVTGKEYIRLSNNTYRTNLVIANIPMATDYTTPIYSKLTLAYTDKDQKTVVIEDPIQTRSVKVVADAIANAISNGNCSETARVQHYVTDLRTSLQMR